MTPVADVGITALKIVVKKAADTPAANAFAEVGRRVGEDIKVGSFSTIERLSDLFVWLAKSDNTDKFFRRGLVNSIDDLDILNAFYKSYGDNADVILGRLYTKFDGQFPEKIAQAKVKDLLKGLTDINIAIGKDLSEDDIDGLAGLMKVDGIDSARLANMAKWLKPPADVELESALKAVKGIDELGVKPPGSDEMFKKFATTSTKEGSNMRGAMNVLRDVGSPGFGGVDKIVAFEVDTSVNVVIDGAVAKFGRKTDVIRKDPAARVEYKSWEAGSPQWTIHAGSDTRDPAWEFVRDVLYSDAPIDFEWVIRGTDLDKVKKKMLQTLGEVSIPGKGKKIHPILEEALDNKFITEEHFSSIVEKLNNGTILRKAGD